MTAGSIEGAAAGYSLQDAAAVLGVSVNTLRKRIRTGQVSAERIERPQGYVWQVYIDGLQPPGQPADHPASQEAPSRLQQPPQVMMQAEAMAAYTRSLLEPMVALVEQQQTVIAEQAETIGALRAQVSTLEARTASQSASDPVTGEPLWRGWPLLVLLAAMVTAIVLLLVTR
jgi:hypothetical protein